MESWRRTLAQFRDLFNNMAPSQRMTLVVVPLFVLAGLGLVMYLGGGRAEEPLLSGKMFSAEELKNAEAALRKGNFSEFRIDGQRILVPRAEVTRYNAALISNAGVPDSFGDDLQKAIEGNPFNMIGEGQRRDGMLFAKAKELVKMIKAIPDIEDARLIPNSPQKRGFSSESRGTAALTVRPRHGLELPQELVHSLRQVVASAFGMSPADVTVINSKTGIAPRLPDKNDPSNDGYVEAIRSFTSHYEQKIKEALAYIPNIVVTANVDVDNLVQSREQERKYDAKQFPYKNLEQTEVETSNEVGPSNEPGMTANQPRAVRSPTAARNARSVEKSTNATDSVPVGTRVTDRQIHGFTAKSVQVAVAIPKDYYRDVLLKQGVDEADKTAFQAKLAQMKTDEEKLVREKVAKLIPVPASGTPAEAINVSSYDRLETTEAALPVSMTTRVGEAVSQWGGPAGLALFALWALWMLNRSAKRTPDGPAPAVGKQPAGKAATALAAALDIEEEPTPKEATKRDKLQTLVKDNPEMAAAVLSRWLSPPK